MSSDNAEPSVDRVLAAGRRLATVANVQDNRFRIAVALAAAVHAALIIGAMRSPPRQMGERSGRADGISVVLVDAADLKSKNTFGEDGGAPGKIPRPPAPTPVAPQRQPPEKSDLPQPNSLPSPPAPEKATPTSRPVDEQKSALRAIEKHTLESLVPPTLAPAPNDAAAKPPPKAEPKAEPKPKPPLDLAIPDIPVAPGARGAAVARPPGATRSGENDEFGRGVIRALRQTMPGPAGQRGRVTVKLLLSNNGNLVEVQLIRGAGIPGLDQSVVFAVRQASFPIPPMGSSSVDRTFLVTYIYN
jgi:periplasmic protein TonB